MLRPEGMFAFSTIELGAAIPSRERGWVAEAAPRAVGTRQTYRRLLASAGFEHTGERDLTEEFRRTTQAWLDASEPVRDRLAAVDGAEAVSDKLHGWRLSAAAIDAGYLHRTLYWGRRPA